QMVPRRIEERVGDVRLAPRAAAALGAFHEIPLFVPREGADARVVRTEVLDERQLDGQVLLRHRYHAALLTVEDGDRRTPVPLPRDAPVVQPVLNARAREPAALEPR